MRKEDKKLADAIWPGKSEQRESLNKKIAAAKYWLGDHYICAKQSARRKETTAV
jgi:hypothetical protein